ncbi:MAG: hypothetical protein WCQ57_08355 [Verrucomicrobiota bacterium]
MRRIFTTLLVLVAAARADWVELKSGQRVEGSISAVTAESIVINAPTSMPGILEPKTIPRGEVAEFKKVGDAGALGSVDDIAFASATKDLPPMTAPDAAIYENILETRIRPFLKEYAYSKHTPEARKFAAQLEAEKKRVLAGEIKVDGQWFSAAESAANPVETSGRVQFGLMKQASSPSEALSIFEKLEKQYLGSSAYPEAVELARLRVADLQRELPGAKARQRQRQAEQQQGITLAREDNRAVLQQALAQEQAATKARVDALKQSGIRWIPLLLDEKTLAELSTIAAAESARLAKLDTAAMRAGVAAAKQATDQAAAGDTAAAKASLAEAQKLWPAYAQLTTIKQTVEKPIVKAPNPTTTPAEKAPPQ